MEDNSREILKIYDYIFEFYFDNNYLEDGPGQMTQTFSGANVFLKLFNVFSRPFRYLKQGIIFKTQLSNKYSTQYLQSKIWLFYHSNNNYESLKFLDKGLEESVWIGHGRENLGYKTAHIPFHRSFLYSFKFFKIWKHLYAKNKNQAIKYFDLIFRIVGLYEVALKAIGKFRPQCLILANDHSEKQRALRAAARKYTVPVVYIQHASISKFHPRLDFDLSLLEGQASLDIYSLKGSPKGQVKFIGMPKFDKFFKSRNTSKKVEKIGICTNVLDSIENAELLMKELIEHFPMIKFSYRAHPNDIRKINLPSSIYISKKGESIFEFLQKQDLLIAGNTSTHLEAVLLNVVSVHFEITPVEPKFQDYYGYIEKGLSFEAKTKKILFHKIKTEINQKTDIFEKAKYYNHLITTEQEGKSSEMAIKYIKGFIEEWQY